MIKKKLPDEPGVYLFKNNLGDIIYVGKAKSLKKRVSQYFSSNLAIKTKMLMKNAADVEFFVVDNEVEALLLENKLIKKHSPKYNINLKDSKTYAYIALTKEEFPRITTYRIKSKEMELFGPFTDGSSRFEATRLATELFRLRTCRKMPKRACLRHHLDLCSAPCITKDKESYSKDVDAARSFLKGNHAEVSRMLEEEMRSFSKELKFEVSLQKKRQIDSIKRLFEKQKVDLIRRNDQSVIAMARFDDDCIFSVLNIKRGVIEGKSEYKVPFSEDVFEEFLKSLYSSQVIPNEIIVSSRFWNNDQEKKSLEEFFSRVKGAKVLINYPKIGDKLGLIRIALKNIAASCGKNPALLEIAEKLNLEDAPSIIECFDISNLGTEHIVAGMTRFVEGNDDKQGFRRFEIKSVAGKNDDFASISEAVFRRYKRLKDEAGEMPSLVLIDGGKGQLGAALGSLESLGLKIPMIALAKKEEEIYVPGLDFPLKFSKNSKMMLLLRKIRDRTHDYALSYNRKKRSMKLKKF